MQLAHPLDCDFDTDASRHSVTNDILTQNRGSQSGEPNSGVARKLRGRDVAVFFFCSLLGVLQNFERVCHGYHQLHAITSTNSEGNVERPNRT